MPPTAVESAPIEPSSGVIRGTTHLFPIRVYYEDTDAGGIVYHAAHVRFAERARTEALRAVARVDQSRLRAETGMVIAVRGLQAAYHRPAYLDDRLVIATMVVDPGPVAFTMQQTIRRQDVPVCTITVELVCLTARGRPCRVPPSLRTAFALLSPTELRD